VNVPCPTVRPVLGVAPWGRTPKHLEVTPVQGTMFSYDLVCGLSNYYYYYYYY